MDIGSVHKKLTKMGRVVLEIGLCSRAERRTDRHGLYNTSSPYRGGGGDVIMHFSRRVRCA